MQMRRFSQQFFLTSIPFKIYLLIEDKAIQSYHIWKNKPLKCVDF